MIRGLLIRLAARTLSKRANAKRRCDVREVARQIRRELGLPEDRRLV